MAGVNSKDTWLSRVPPFGLIAQTKPKDYRDILRVVWENRKEIPYAWNILNHGVCDGCSLGPFGLRDNVLDGVHLCMKRLKLLKLNTMATVDLSAMSDVGWLRRLEPERLRSLGRLSHPMVRRKGERGFLRVSWEEALDLVCKPIRKAAPHELAFVATTRRLTNEVYYVVQKLARVLGTNNLDLCAAPCHEAWVSGLQATLGYGAPTCSLSDLIGTDLLVVFGSGLAHNQPVATEYLEFAKKAGTRIVSVSTLSDRRLDDYPSSSRAESDFKLTDDGLKLRAGGDVAFINGVLKFLILAERIDRSFVDKNTTGFGELAETLESQSWNMLEQCSGVAREAMQRFAESYSQARTAVFVSSAGPFEKFGIDEVKAVVNLALARGMLGREKCGIMPVGGESGVHGGRECGAAPDKFPGGFAVNDGTARRFSNLWHHPVPSKSGLKLPEMFEAARGGSIKFLYSVGANLLDAISDPQLVTDALTKVPLRVHQDIALDASMLLDPEEAVVLLPAQTRYEQRSGGTSTSTERRIRFTPEITGHPVGEALPEWEIPVLIGRKSMSNGDKLFPFNDTQAIREEMSRVMPIYNGIEKLTQEGDQLQWGGPQLYQDGFTAMPQNRAVFSALVPQE